MFSRIGHEKSFNTGVLKEQVIYSFKGYKVEFYLTLRQPQCSDFLNDSNWHTVYHSTHPYNCFRSMPPVH